MLLIYNLFIRIYYLAVRMASLWNKKAAAWIAGRQSLFAELEKKISRADRFIWVHCSSAGEFEQGKPVMEALKKAYPEHKVLVSFFSPSGYATAKNYWAADVITYLPLDTRKNAERFIKLVQPELAVFVKYEFWFHHLSAAAFHHIPLLLISAVFREEQVFFKRYGSFFRQMLFLFRHIFVQDPSSLALLQARGITHSSISGDTRFDRVKAIARHANEIPAIRSFIGDNKILVAGSTWEGDEVLLAAYLKQNRDIKLIIAPHEVNKQHVNSLRALFDNALLFSAISTGEKDGAAGHEGHIFNDPLPGDARTLIIDSVGLLSRLYQYATLTYVGGGFTRDGIHNILEAAVWNKPVLFGPNYKKYREAGELIDAGGAFSVRSAQELKKIADDLLTKEDHLQKVSGQAGRYIENNTGATVKLIQAIQEKRLLTR